MTVRSGQNNSRNAGCTDHKVPLERRHYNSAFPSFPSHFDFFHSNQRCYNNDHWKQDIIILPFCCSVPTLFFSLTQIKVVVVVGWCFTPSQLVRLYQGNSNQRCYNNDHWKQDIIILPFCCSHPTLFFSLTQTKVVVVVRCVLRPVNRCSYIRVIQIKDKDATIMITGKKTS